MILQMIWNQKKCFAHKQGETMKYELQIILILDWIENTSTKMEEWLILS